MNWPGAVQMGSLADSLHSHVELEPVFRCDFSHVLHCLSAVAVAEADLCKWLQWKDTAPGEHGGEASTRLAPKLTS